MFSNISKHYEFIHKPCLQRYFKLTQLVSKYHYKTFLINVEFLLYVAIPYETNCYTVYTALNRTTRSPNTQWIFNHNYTKLVKYSYTHQTKALIVFSDTTIQNVNGWFVGGYYAVNIKLFKRRSLVATVALEKRKVQITWLVV